jgi:hypothetical protein
LEETVNAVAASVKAALQAFLSASVLLLAVLGDEYRPEGYTNPPSDASLQDLMALFKVRSSPYPCGERRAELGVAMCRQVSEPLRVLDMTTR